MVSQTISISACECGSSKCNHDKVILKIEGSLKTLRRKIRTKQQQRQRLLKQINDPNYRDKLNKEAKTYYHKNRKKEIAHSTKWNKNNKDKRNATRRKRYALNKDAINEKRRKKRLG